MLQVFTGRQSARMALPMTTTRSVRGGFRVGISRAAGVTLFVVLVDLIADPGDGVAGELAPTPTQQLYAEGLEAYRVGEISQAMTTWEHALDAMELEMTPAQGDSPPRREREILLAGKETLLRGKITPWGIQVSLGAARLELGRYEEAEQSFREALDGAAAFSDPAGKGDAELGLSLASLYRSDYEASRRYALAALGIYDRVEDRAGAVDALTVLGSAEYHRGAAGKSERAFQQATKLAESAGLVEAQARLLNNLGEVCKTTGEFMRAVEVQSRALDLARRRGAGHLEWPIGINLAEGFLLSGDVEKAAALSDEWGAALRSEIRDPDLRWRGFYILAQVRERQGKVREALDHYGQAIAEIEAIRVHLQRPVYKIRYQDDKYKVFDRAALLAWRSGLLEESFVLLERARSRALMDVLLSGRTYDAPTLPLPDLESVHRLTARSVQVEIVARRLVGLGGEEGAPAEPPRIVERVPFGRLGFGRAVAPGKLLSLIPEGTALVEFVLLDQRWVVFVLTRHAWQARRLDASARQLDLLLERFRTELQEQARGEPAAFERPTDRSVYHRLYRLLVEPIEDLIAGCDDLVIVPDGSLYYVPFPALLGRNGRYLVEDYRVSFLPSASSLGLFLGREPDPIRSVLAVGNPATGMGDLPHAESEARRVASLFPGSLLLRGPQATKAGVLLQAREFDAVLLSVHADLTPAEPLSGSVYLASAGGGVSPLTVAEVFEQRLKARVVVLSGCQTGLVAGLGGGRAGGGGQEMVGLARAFLYAGTPSVVGSLWRVEDTATAFLVERFFREAAAGVRLAEALRRAQLALMRRAEHGTLKESRLSCLGQVEAEEGLERLMAHPFFWAAFILTGDGR